MKKVLKWVLMVLGGLFLLGAVAGAFVDNEDKDTAAKDEAPIEVSQPVAKEETVVTEEESTEEEPTEEEPVVVEEEPAEEVAAEPEVTLSQKNAMKKAENYLILMGFSKSGLVGQLEFEGFDTADATYAVENIEVDWSAQAVRKGQSYLDLMPFSRSGLVDQLKFEGFTEAEAQYAVDELGL